MEDRKDIFGFLDSLCDTFISFKCIYKNVLYKTGGNIFITDEWYDAMLNSLNESSGFPDNLLYRGFIFRFTKINENELPATAE